MDPIVSPWIIYGIEMLNAVNTFLGSAMFVSGTVTILFSLMLIASDPTEKERDICQKKLWIPLTTFLVFGSLFVLLPSRDTGYKMLAASYVTTDNIKAVGGATNEAIDSILDNVVKHMNEVKK